MSLLDSFGSSGDMSSQRIYGVLIGIVTNNKDPEKLGRLKVKLQLRESENETEWARVASFMTGKEMGNFFLPEVGDEVLVVFNDGDARKPYVIGALWNSVSAPPLTNEDGKNNIRKIKSRNGNEFIFNDEAGKESVTIKTKAGQTISLEDENSGKIQIKEKSGNNSVIIDGQNNQVDIKANMKLNIVAGSCKINIDSTQNSIAIESAMQLKIKAQMIDIEAGANLNIKSDGMLSIKGTMVKIN
jgi:uncharacterized protein involved in type VI secretion and phage assembly